MKPNSYKKNNYLTICIIIIFLFLSQITSFGENTSKKHVLILNSYSSDYDWSNNIVNGINSVLDNKNNVIRTEYMDTKTINDDEYLKKIYDLYKYKFKNYKFDVIVCTDNDAFNFLRKYNSQLFPNVPIVFCGVNNFDKSMLPSNNLFTGVVEEVNIKETIDLSLKLHPNTEKIYIITDTTSTGNSFKKYLYKLIPYYKNNIDFIFNEDLNLEEIKKQTKILPKDSIILIAGIIKDNFGEVISEKNASKILSKNCNIPIYTFWNQYLGHGVVGGMLTNGYYQGESAGRLALSILKGLNISDIPIITKSPNEYMFDYNQLKRFNINHLDLPENSMIMNKPNPFYYIPKKTVYYYSALIIIILLIIILILLFNIYKRRQFQKLLEKSKEHYQNLIEILPCCVLIHNNNKIAFSNKSGLDLLGADNLQQIQGKSILDFIHKDYKDIVQNRINLGQKGYTCDLIEEKIITLNGKYIDMQVSATPCTYQNSQAVLVVARDITEYKKSQELQKRIYEEEKRLKEALEYDKLKTEFFANLSHELKTPLNLIFSSIQLLEIQLENNLIDNKSNIEKRMKVLKQNTYRILRLVNNLIDITKIDSGYFDLKLQNHNIVDVIENITLSVAEYTESKNISLIFDTDIEEKIMSIDPDTIERIILNLLSNAIKFTKPGGKITVNIFNKEDHIILSVKDTGTGIPEDKLKIIFDRFRQVDKSLTRNNEGSGIGLSLVSSIVRMYDGEITVNSTCGEGSEFIIKLPAKVLPDTITKTNTSNINAMKNRYIEKVNIEFSDIYSWNYM